MVTQRSQPIRPRTESEWLLLEGGAKEVLLVFVARRNLGRTSFSLLTGCGRVPSLHSTDPLVERGEEPRN